MSRFDYDLYEKHDFYASDSAAVAECRNCKTSGVPLSEICLNDGGTALLCDECAEEERRMEARAVELVNARPGLLCEEREQLIERAVSTNWLVNKLVAHDQTCRICSGSLRMPVQSVVAAQTNHAATCGD